MELLLSKETSTNGEQDRGEPGIRHRAIASGPDGVRPLSLAEAVARIRRGSAAAPAARPAESAGAESAGAESAGAESAGAESAGAESAGGETVAAAEAVPADVRQQGIVWIDIVRPTEEDGVLLRKDLGFHPLAVEDCLFGKQNPKLERYPGYFFLVLYAARINPERNRPAFYELHCFMGSHYIVTVRYESVREVRELMARWRSAPQHYSTVGHLAHGIV
ncbi:MAG TPA: CorA family divalent cation transporter, partial [Longimicrobiales bacterium]|nr:CorA family divalent cation transporter [Longimicrobiales bacterium]